MLEKKLKGRWDITAEVEERREGYMDINGNEWVRYTKLSGGYYGDDPSATDEYTVNCNIDYLSKNEIRIYNCTEEEKITLDGEVTVRTSVPENARFFTRFCDDIQVAYCESVENIIEAACFEHVYFGGCYFRTN